MDSFIDITEDKLKEAAALEKAAAALRAEAREDAKPKAAKLPSLEGKNLCDPVFDEHGKKHAFSHAVTGWYSDGGGAYGCMCGWEGTKTDFDQHMADAYESLRAWEEEEDEGSV